MIASTSKLMMKLIFPKLRKLSLFASHLEDANWKMTFDKYISRKIRKMKIARNQLRVSF